MNSAVPIMLPKYSLLSSSSKLHDIVNYIFNYLKMMTSTDDHSLLNRSVTLKDIE